MNMKKTMILAVCMMTMLILFTGCSADNPLPGTWTLVDAEGSELIGLDSEVLELAAAFGGYIRITFTDKDMTVTAEMFGAKESQTQSYTLKGNTLSFHAGNTLSYEIKDGTLTLSDGNSSIILTKSK